MNLLAELKARFTPALSQHAVELHSLLAMIRPAQDAKFGDYQANFAMSLGKTLGKPPRDVAQQIVAQTKLDDLCESVEVAGPGFINLRIKDNVLRAALVQAIGEERLGVTPVVTPRTYVVDYSSPNVAKPMHVGHIRSTVIGDALYRILKFVGHNVISDNHLGDWGTQFGMIIYGYKHFGNRAAYEANPVAELSRLYKLVHKLVDYYETKAALPKVSQELAAKEQMLTELGAATVPVDKNEQKKHDKQVQKLKAQIKEAEESLGGLQKKLSEVEGSPELSRLVAQHATICDAVLQETAKLHSGDEENLKLWHEFLPACRDEIQRVYSRLNIRFDHELGESFYHDQLSAVVEEFLAKGFARESDGAICVFFPDSEVPMIIRKKDGAFLYATTDLATIKYRMQNWQPDAMLYVVDHRQGEHFDKLFAAAKLWGYNDIELQHIGFGTVLGDDGKPYKTRSGDTIGLEGLLNEAVSRALKVVSENDRDAQLNEEERQHVAEIVGIGALKYADLSQNRTSDYTFSYDKMLAMNGNTATYMQYSYARVQSIFRKGEIDIAQLRALNLNARIKLLHWPERALALQLVRFSEALDEATADYRPNLLTNYLLDLAKAYSKFFEECLVLKGDDDLPGNYPGARTSRLLLCDLTARTIKQGLELLGIGTVEKM